jgi:hypothetical protein
VRFNQESTERQYNLANQARALGWIPERIRILDGDLAQYAHATSTDLDVDLHRALLGAELISGLAEDSRPAASATGNRRTRTQFDNLSETVEFFQCIGTHRRTTERPRKVAYSGQHETTNPIPNEITLNLTEADRDTSMPSVLGEPDHCFAYLDTIAAAKELGKNSRSAGRITEFVRLD